MEQLRPDVIEKRAAYRKWMKTADPDRLIFIDETGCNTLLVPEYGWSPRGERIVDHRPGRHGPNFSVVGAIRRDKLLCHDKFEGALNTARWVEFVEKKLCPTLLPGDSVVVDNPMVHKNKHARDLIEAEGAEFVFLPPYSCASRRRS